MNEWAGEWLPKLFVYSGLFVAAGAGIAHWLLRSRGSPTSELARIEAHLSWVGLISASVVLVALLARALFHTATAFGWSEAFLWENLRLVAMESRWGGSWQLQVYAGASVIAAALATRRWTVAWIAYTGAVGALALTIPLVGHAAGSTARYLLHALHVIAGVAWLGSLAVLVTLRWTANSAGTRPKSKAAASSSSVASPSSAASSSGLPSPSSPASYDIVEPLIQRFSPLALSGATAVAISGTIAAFLYVASFQNLLGSTYGRILLLKTLCVAFVAGCGSLNWRRVRAREAPLTGVMLAEVLVALVVVIVTSVLTETEYP